MSRDLQKMDAASDRYVPRALNINAKTKESKTLTESERSRNTTEQERYRTTESAKEWQKALLLEHKKSRKHLCLNQRNNKKEKRKHIEAFI